MNALDILAPLVWFGLGVVAAIMAALIWDAIDPILDDQPDPDAEDDVEAMAHACGVSRWDAPVDTGMPYGPDRWAE